MIWTKEKPKCAGFYWKRTKNCSDVVVEVYADDSGELWFCHTPVVHYRLSKMENSLWSDVPVQMPSEE